MEGFAPITGEEHELLVAKCQENGWLKRGGYDWQDDPFMEEYPYEFSKAESIEDLRNAFARGNWAIRQGFVYEDLAFIQQVNGGDEWWTCKRFDGEWVDFESWSFGRISLDPAEFEDATLHGLEDTREAPEPRRQGPGSHPGVSNARFRNSAPTRTQPHQISQET